MEGEGKGLRALGFACLILSATVAAPALSPAQDPAKPPSGVSASPPTASQPGTPGGEAEDVPADGEAVDRPADQGGASASLPPASQPGTPEGEAEDVSAEGEAVIQTAVAPPKQAKASAATVSVGDNFFAPTSVTIFAGESVTWRNDGQAQHSATANNGSFDTGIFGPGQSRSETFSSPGSFAYYCVVHGLSQSGTVKVSAASGGGGGGGGGGGSGGGGGGGSDSAASDSSEAAAVASPSAAGTSTSLPSTGFAAVGLALVGLVLLASGIAIGRAAPRP